MGSTGRKNTGRIFIRANKYYLRYRINDKEKTVSLGIKTDQADAKNKAKKEAAKYLPILEAQTRKEVAAHVAIAKRLEKERQHLPLSDAWKIFEASPFRPHCSTKTLAGHKQKFTHFINWLGQNIPLIDRIDKIDSSITANYAASLTKISGRNYNAYIGSLKLIFKTLLQQRKIETNPFDCIVKRPLETVSKADFDDEQMEAILTTFEDSKLHLMHKTETETLYYLGTYTGLRLNDCVLSEWKDYNLKTKLITCIPYKTRKSNRSVIIPMHPTLLKKLKELKKENNSKYILPEIASRYQYNETGVKKDVIKVLEYAGIIEAICKEDTPKDAVRKREKRKLYGFHSLRHRFVTNCAKAGVPLAAVQAIVGHGNPTITRVYTHIGTNSLKDAIQAQNSEQDKVNVLPEAQKLLKIKKLLESKKKPSQLDKKVLKIVTE